MGIQRASVRLARLHNKSIHDPWSGCWLYQGTRTKKGYGQTMVEGRWVRLHRWSYQYFVGPIPQGLVLDHLCRSPGCWNPDHLEPVTNRTNILRGEGYTAVNARKTHCVHGHEFSPENTRVRIREGGATRECRTCRRLHKNNQRRRQRERLKGA